MRLLLDTHAIIWLAHELHKVPQRVITTLADAEISYASVASAWEYGVKRAKQQTTLAISFVDLLAGADIEPLGLDFACHSYAESLPPIHSDPFDRMLIAQALHHRLTLVTSDRTIQRYPVDTIW